MTIVISASEIINYLLINKAQKGVRLISHEKLIQLAILHN